MNDLPSKKQLESTGENHGFRLNPKQFAGILIAIVLVIFILSNRERQTVDFLFVELTVPLGLILTGTAVGALALSRRQKRHARRAAR